ncbi:MAG TPA: GIY-YIG nuclease family protein [Chitinophagales bacterium]|jgi:hypothetical protein|nr:GIY-YIG nuclease family protein [Chitinophagales bacterium]
MTKEQQLRAIFDNDPFDLLKIVNKPKQTPDDRLLGKFKDIMQFYDENSRLPEYSKINIQECELYYELEALKTNVEKCKVLYPYDEYDLLEFYSELQPKKYNTIDDIINDDTFGILTTENSIFDLKHIRINAEREKAKEIAKRKKCKEFELYEPLFKQCNVELKNGLRQLIKFNEDHIKQGSFFVVDGMLAYVKELEQITRGKHSKLDGRIHCIFDNGTMSNLLFRSLGKALYKNGNSVTEVIEKEKPVETIIQNEDEHTGFIYILKSKSKNPDIKAIPNLFKIGFSTTEVEDRIKNATKEPTYLMAEVQIVYTYKCYNLNAQKFENLIHSFFGNACLDMDIYDNAGSRHKPQEWFSIPLPAIEKAIELIMRDSLKKYKYNYEKEQLNLRKKD